MIMCTSKCTDDMLEFCCLGIIDFGQIYCMNCYAYGTPLWEKKQLQKRFGDSWEFKHRELKDFSREVKRKVRSLRKTGHNPAETIYFIDPPLHPELHAGHMNFAGEHIRRPEKLAANPLQEMLVIKMRKEGNLPKKSYLTGFGSHG